MGQATRIQPIPGRRRCATTLMTTLEIERREAARYALALTLDFDAGTGITRDISALGLFFETDAPVAVGDSGRFALRDVDSTPAGIAVTCEGRVVRVERNGGRHGVAVIVERIYLGPDSGRFEARAEQGQRAVGEAGLPAIDGRRNPGRGRRAGVAARGRQHLVADQNRGGDQRRLQQARKGPTHTRRK
jgi:hypothetical protein